MEQKPELTLEMPAPTLTLDAQPATPADQKAAEEKVDVYKRQGKRASRCTPWCS